MQWTRSYQAPGRCQALGQALLFCDVLTEELWERQKSSYYSNSLRIRIRATVRRAPALWCGGYSVITAYVPCMHWLSPQISPMTPRHDYSHLHFRCEDTKARRVYFNDPSLKGLCVVKLVFKCWFFTLQSQNYTVVWTDSRERLVPMGRWHLGTLKE